MNPALQAAIDLADQGIPVFPVLPDKRPAIAGGFKSATFTPNESNWPAQATLVGVPTGAASGLTVLDIDPGNGGDEWLRSATLPVTRQHETRSGGVHMLFRYAPGVRNSASRIAPGVDVRGDGGYIVWWPADGFPVLHGDAAAEWPSWLAAAKPKPAVVGGSAATSISGEPETVLARIMAGVHEAPDGSKHEALRNAAILLGGVLHAMPFDFAGAVERLVAALPETVEDYENAESTARWGLQEGCKRPVGIVAPGAEFSVAAAPQPVAGARLAMRERFVFPTDCGVENGRGYVAKGLLAPGDVGALIGQPGSGKSVLGPHLAYAVAQGRAVFGCRVKPGRVLYVATEDAAGMRQRVHALRLRHGDAPGFALADCGNLRDMAMAADLRAAVADWQPALVVIDTLGAGWAGLDENSAQDMGQVVALTRRIAATGAAVLLVHHTAKQGDGSPRGHSVLNGTLDMSVRLEPADESGVIRARLGKNRNGTTERDMAFKISVAVLGTDDDGDQITAPVAYELAAGAPEAAKAARLPRSEAAALGVLRDMAAGTLDGRVAEDGWLRECDNRRVSTAESAKDRRDVIRRAFSGLRDRGRVAAGEGFVWVPVADNAPSDRSDSRAIVATAAVA